jgi:hypothetical protein
VAERIDVEWPLIGRDGDLAVIAAALRGGAGIVVSGPAGVGKSRLAREALAGHDGARWVRASGSARSVPLAAFVPLVGAMDGPDRTTLLMRAHAALQVASVVGIDDAHQLDDVSATLLHQAAVERTTRLVVTVREGALAPDAVTALWKDGLLARIDLGPLTVVQTGALVSAVLGGRLAQESARRLHHFTSGNPLWLRHLVPAELQAGRFAATVGVWSWTGGARLVPALAALLEAQLGALAPELAAVLELLAVGEPLDVAMVAGLTDREALEDAVALRLVTVDGQAVRLAHPLYGESVLTRAGPLRALRSGGPTGCATRSGSC